MPLAGRDGVCGYSVDLADLFLWLGESDVLDMKKGGDGVLMSVEGDIARWRWTIRRHRQMQTGTI